MRSSTDVDLRPVKFVGVQIAEVDTEPRFRQVGQNSKIRSMGPRTEGHHMAEKREQ